MSIPARHCLLLFATAFVLTACTAKDDPATTDPVRTDPATTNPATDDAATVAPALDGSPTVEIRRAETAPAAGLTAVSPRPEAAYVPGAVYVYDTVEFTDADFTEATLAQDNLGRASVLLKLTDSAAERMETLTRAHLEKPLAITVHGELVAAPIIVLPLSSAMMITGLSEEEARGLIDELNGR